MSKEKIKQAAIVQFAVNGYEGATLGSIAKDVGIKTPSIYAFFESKESLFLAAYQEVLDDHLAHIQKISDDFEHLSTEEKLYGVLQKVCNYHLKQENETKFLNRAMLFPPQTLRTSIHVAFLREEDILSGFLSEIFEQGMEEGSIIKRDLNDLLAAYFCLLDGVFLQLFYYSSSEFEARVESSWKVFWSGISRSAE